MMKTAILALVIVAISTSSSAAYTQAQAQQAQLAFQRNFRTADAFSGKHCDILIKTDAAGSPTSITAHGGDGELCEESINIARDIKYPATGEPESFELNIAP